MSIDSKLGYDKKINKIDIKDDIFKLRIITQNKEKSNARELCPDLKKTFKFIMKIQYDYKFGGIIVEVDDNELSGMLNELRKHYDASDSKSEAKELFNENINFITYQKADEKHSEQNSKTYILMFASVFITITVIIFSIMGFYKFIEILLN